MNNLPVVPHSVPVWVNIGVGDLHLLLLSRCDFFANWSSTTHTLLEDIYEMLPAFFNFSSDLDTVQCRRGSHSCFE